MCHLIGLKHALAGDLESNEALETLLERLKRINWNDPVFIQFSKEMREGMPKLTPEQEAASVPSTREMLHFQNEQLAQRDETMSSLLPALRKSAEDFQKISDFSSELLSYIKKLLELHIKMQDQLELLGVDARPYALPKIPNGPKL